MSLNDPNVAKLRLQAYETLSSYLLAYHDQVIEIEILPPTLQLHDGLTMQHGRCLGIPNRVLALAFVEARDQFLQNANDEEFPSAALLATKVILLFDPEYLAAANFRKRRLVALQAESTTHSQAAFRKAVKHEFCFLDSILTSHLHRQTKSPTLWHHRLWLLDLSSPNGFKNASAEQRAGFYRAELDAVRKSGERHPKNYYAWQYARRLMDRLRGDDEKLEFARQVKNWCYMHPSDTSGWSCLFYLITGLESLSQRENLVEDVLSYAISLRSEHESLWVFLRTILAHDTLHERRVELITMLRNYSKRLENLDQASLLPNRVTETLNWITTHSKSLDLPGALKLV